MKIKDVLALRLIQRRKKLNLTQLQVAGRAGISTVYLAHLEHARRTPQSRLLNRLCNALSCSSDYLLGRSPHPQKGAVSTTVEPVVATQQPTKVRKKKLKPQLPAPPEVVIVVDHPAYKPPETERWQG